MTYAVVALTCVFAGSYIFLAHSALSTRLFLRAAANVMLILVAVSARTAAIEPYYTLIVVGLSFSLGADILFFLSGISYLYLKIGAIMIMAASAAYMAAFLTVAAPTWYDGAFLLLLLGAGMLSYRLKGTQRHDVMAIAQTIFLCGMVSKALSMLFAHVGIAFSVCAAVGGALLMLSDMFLAFGNVSSFGNIVAKGFGIVAYYGGQMLIALTVML